MNLTDLINMSLLGVVAVSLVAIAVQLNRLAASAQSITPLLQKYLSEFWDQDGHPPHHFYFTSQDLLVWEWREGAWSLRTSGVAAGETGLPPQRAGSYEGECVTTRRSGSSR